MPVGIELRAEPLRSLAYGSISSSYAPIGAPIANTGRLMMIQNLTDSTLTFSFDGIVDHFVLPSQGFFLIDVTTNRADPAGTFLISIGTQMSVKGSAGAGSVYVTSLYAKGS